MIARQALVEIGAAHISNHDSVLPDTNHVEVTRFHEAPDRSSIAVGIERSQRFCNLADRY